MSDGPRVREPVTRLQQRSECHPESDSTNGTSHPLECDISPDRQVDRDSANQRTCSLGDSREHTHQIPVVGTRSHLANTAPGSLVNSAPSDRRAQPRHSRILPPQPVHDNAPRQLTARRSHPLLLAEMAPQGIPKCELWAGEHLVNRPAPSSGSRVGSGHLATSAIGRSSESITSASRSLVRICSGECRRRAMLRSILPDRAGSLDSHSRWTRSRGSGHSDLIRATNASFQYSDTTRITIPLCEPRPTCPRSNARRGCCSLTWTTESRRLHFWTGRPRVPFVLRCESHRSILVVDAVRRCRLASRCAWTR